MRVITGTARGRRLAAPQGLDTRPTTDMVKEAVFSVIQFEVPGLRVLDLFAGSGQMGIEALSRGASFATFVDNGKAAVQSIRDNVAACDFEEQSKIYPMDANTFLMSCGEKFGLALIDPPYNEGLLIRILPMVAKVMEPGGIILCETSRDEVLPETVASFTNVKKYRHGKVMIHLYRDGRERA